MVRSDQIWNVVAWNFGTRSNVGGPSVVRTGSHKLKIWKLWIGSGRMLGEWKAGLSTSFSYWPGRWRAH